MKGSYVVFEGIDGSGKSTMMQAVAEYWMSQDGIVYQIQGYAVPEFRELLRKELRKSTPNQRFLALLFAADRARQMEIIQEKTCAHDTLVLSDRSFISSLVYQTVESDLSVTWLETVNLFCIEPDKIIFCDISVDEALARISTRDGHDGFEARNFLEKVRDNYNSMLSRYGGKVLTLDTTGDLDENAKKVFDFILI
jgi:dTMP kinase